MVLIYQAFFLPYDQLDDESKELYEALKKVDWSVKLVCPQGMEMSLTNTHISVEHIARGRVHNNRIGRYLDWLYQKNLVGIGLQNVVIGAGFYFVGKKVRHVYYAGIDMSEFKQLFVEENNEIYVHCVHNYGETKMKFSDDESMKFHEVLKCYQKMFEQFYYLSCYAERQGVKITNLSCNSYVDVFQKERLFLKEPRMTMD